jgi:ABC-type lipoprotein export system ATPase subunit
MGDPTATSVVSTTDLRKTYRRGRAEIEALRGVDLEVASGEMLVIMGPSGGGKSTLLHLIGGIDRPTSGGVVVAGQDLVAASQPQLDAFRRSHIGIVFQFFNLLGTATARDNVALGLMARGFDWKAARARAAELLATVGLADRVGHRPAELSGGEQQRVAIARAIGGEPELVLADEPTGDVDSATARDLMKLLARLNRDMGSTFIIVTHNELLTQYATRVMVLRDGTLDV